MKAVHLIFLVPRTFCSMYKDVPFRIEKPIEQIDEDLREVQDQQPNAERVYLVGGDPFVLSFEQLKLIAEKIKEYLSHCKTISMYARITNIKSKTTEELKTLRFLGINQLYIGIETGHNGITLGLFPEAFPIKYKIKSKIEFGLTKSELGRMVDLFKRLSDFHPPVHNVTDFFNDSLGIQAMSKKGFKNLEDKLDAFLCAYAANWLAKNEGKVFGDDQEGFIGRRRKRNSRLEMKVEQ